MEFYTLDPFTLERKDIIDGFQSAIWTEKFIEAGEAKLVLPATRDHIRMLAPSTLLSLRGSTELVLLDTREISEGMLTVSGKTLEAFFEVRGTESGIYRNVPPRWLIHAVVSGIEGMGIQYYQGFDKLRNPFSPSPDPADPAYPPGRFISKKWERGDKAYPIMLEIAKKHMINMALRRTTERDEFGIPNHELLFTTNYGVDRSSSQPEGSDNNIVRFSPDLDNLTAIKELRSDADYINFVIVWPPDLTVPAGHPPGGIPNFLRFHNTADGRKDPPDISPFERRFEHVSMSDVTAQDIADRTNGFKKGPLWPEGYYDVIVEMMRDRAEKVFADHRRTKIVDGEAIPGTQFEYERDYDLGDFVDIDGDFGAPMNGRVVEYIRSEDASGVRTYPTIEAQPYVKLDGW